MQVSQKWRLTYGWALNAINISYGSLFFVPRFRESAGTLNLIRPSVCPSVRPSVCPSVTKTLTLAMTFALLQVELWYLACVFFVTRPFWWYHIVTLTVPFDLLQGQICCQAGDHNSLNLLTLVWCLIVALQLTLFFLNELCEIWNWNSSLVLLLCKFFGTPH